MSTSRRVRNKILGVITRVTAQRLLEDWANVKLDRSGIEMLRKRYPGVFSGLDDYFVAELQGQLQIAWKDPDARHRDWYLSQIRNYYYQSFPREDSNSTIGPREIAFGDAGRVATVFRRPASYQLVPPPPITEFEAALVYFQTQLGDRAKHCGGPECSAPYFIAAKRWQKFCSEKCAGPANRASKRQWWRENRAKNGGLE